MGYNIRYRSNRKRWQADINYEGLRLRKSFTEKEHAELWACRKYANLLGGTPDLAPDGRSVSFGKFAEIFMAEFSTNKRDRIGVKPLVGHFSSTRLGKIHEWQIKKYQKVRQESVQNKTINHEVDCLKHMLNVAVQEGYARNLPRINWREVRLPTQSRNRVFTDDEIERIKKFAPKWFILIIDWVLNTGMRRSDFSRIAPEHIDLERGEIRMIQAKTGKPLSIPLNETARLIVYKNSENLQRYGLLFVNAVSKPVLRVHHMFKKAADKAGVEDARFYDLRHTFATKVAMLDRGAVPAMIGDSAKIADIYINLQHGYRLDLLNRLGESKL